MAEQIGNHQQGLFSNPTDGVTAYASDVKTNDNALRVTTNAHDSDPGLHFESVPNLVSIPAPSARQYGKTLDRSTGRIYFSDGVAWAEIGYALSSHTHAPTALTGWPANAAGALTNDGAGVLSWASYPTKSTVAAAKLAYWSSTSNLDDTSVTYDSANTGLYNLTQPNDAVGASGSVSNGTTTIHSYTVPITASYLLTVTLRDGNLFGASGYIQVNLNGSHPYGFSGTLRLNPAPANGGNTVSYTFVIPATAGNTIAVVLNNGSGSSQTVAYTSIARLLV